MKKDKGLSNVSLSYSHLTEAKNRIEKKFGSQNYLAYKMTIDWQEIAEDVLYKDRETETKEVEFDGKKYTVVYKGKSFLPDSQRIAYVTITGF